MTGKSPKAVVHIGQPKTGTKSLQRFLAQNRKRLHDVGFSYPDFLGEPSQFWLSLLTFGHKPSTSNPFLLYLSAQVNGEWEQVIANKRQMLIDWSSKRSDDILIFSSEGLSTLLRLPQIAQLRVILEQCVQEIEIIVYLREPVARSISAWSTTLLAGFSKAESLKEFRTESREHHREVEYQESRGLGNLVEWEKTFPGQVRVRLFDPREFIDGDLERDFCAIAGIPWSDDFERAGRINEILAPEAMAYVAHLNKWVDKSPSHSPLRNHEGNLRSILAMLGDKTTRYEPSREEVQEIYESQSRAINWVRNKYFDSKTELFSSERDQHLSRSGNASAGSLPDPNPLLFELLISLLEDRETLAATRDALDKAFCDLNIAVSSNLETVESLARINAESLILKNQLNAISASRSWRLTSVFRKAKSYFK